MGLLYLSVTWEETKQCYTSWGGGRNDLVSLLAGRLRLDWTAAGVFLRHEIRTGSAAYSVLIGGCLFKN